jgi:aryl-alcohol dehydrogenase-like predicted oxidoreductase
MTAQGTRTTQTLDGDHPGSVIIGRADPEATLSYASRFASSFADDFYRETATALTVSSIGMGTYLGECDDAEDERYTNILAAGIGRGLNLLDTAINYRCQRSEKAVGRALQKALRDGDATREEIVVCTKGGYIPLVGSPPDTRDAYRSYLKSEYFDRGIMSPGEVVVGGHCLKPGFLADQVERSRANLGIECIDVFYLHNPEQQLNVLSRAQFLDAMRDAFTKLESLVAGGSIGCYGCATWNGFRIFAANKNYLSLAELMAVAVEAGGKDHHFRVVQLPVNLAMTEGVRSPTQHDGFTNLPFVEMAKDCGVSVVASAALMQSQLTHDLPPAVETMYPGLESDAQRAIAFVRSLPVASVLVGMRVLEHLEENLRAARASAPVPANRS